MGHSAVMLPVLVRTFAPSLFLSLARHVVNSLKGILDLVRDRDR